MGTLTPDPATPTTSLERLATALVACPSVLDPEAWEDAQHQIELRAEELAQDPEKEPFWTCPVDFLLAMLRRECLLGHPLQTAFFEASGRPELNPRLLWFGFGPTQPFLDEAGRSLLDYLTLEIEVRLDQLA